MFLIVLAFPPKRQFCSVKCREFSGIFWEFSKKKKKNPVGNPEIPVGNPGGNNFIPAARRNINMVWETLYCNCILFRFNSQIV